MLNMPVISKKVKERICEQVMNEFGGKIYEVVVGGAGLNVEIQDFLASIGFPFTVGYGTTETAPMISYADWPVPETPCRYRWTKDAGAP